MILIAILNLNRKDWWASIVNGISLNPYMMRWSYTSPDCPWYTPYIVLPHLSLVMIFGIYHQYWFLFVDHIICLQVTLVQLNDFYFRLIPYDFPTSRLTFWVNCLLSHDYHLFFFQNGHMHFNVCYIDFLEMINTQNPVVKTHDHA